MGRQARAVCAMVLVLLAVGPVGLHAASVTILIQPGDLRVAWLVSLVLLLGLCIAVLVMNYWVAECPVKGLTIGAWVLILVSVVLLTTFAAPDTGRWFALAGAGIGVLVQWRGCRLARARRREQEAQVQESASDKAAQDETLSGLVGEEGIAISDIKPHGRVNVGGQVVDVKSATFIPAETSVVVTAIDDGLPVVEPRP